MDAVELVGPSKICNKRSFFKIVERQIFPSSAKLRLASSPVGNLPKVGFSIYVLSHALNLLLILTGQDLLVPSIIKT